MKLSVIVRFHNEATHLAYVLAAIRAQHSLQGVEIVAIDNASTDDSRLIAERLADTVLDITDYRPGAALNRAIDSCTGGALVVLSAHALPATRSWLENLTSWLSNPGVLGTYGAQLYPVTSRFLDKRDLDIFSSLRPRTELSDSDFWNANSCFLRSAWDKEQFDETVIELEDHHWTKKILPQSGQWVRFQPDALVYHYGHDARNDRTFLPPNGLSAEEHLKTAIATLEREDEFWPAIMSAGLTLASLSHHPGIQQAVPAIGRTLLEHEDFDIRWRMAGTLGRIGTADAARYLAVGLSDPSFYARDECAWALGRSGAAGAAEVLRVADALDTGYRPFAALALGLSGDRSAGVHAMRLLDDSIHSEDTGQIRDSLYFLGEMTDIDGVAALAPLVETSINADTDEVLQAAAWCWGMLLARYPDTPDLDPHKLIAPARQHPIETVRLEAVIALGRAARAGRSTRLAQEVASILDTDGSGRVRYGAIQSLRLLTESGLDCRSHVIDHQYDSDFGVRFERSLILGETTTSTESTPHFETEG